MTGWRAGPDPAGRRRFGENPSEAGYSPDRPCSGWKHQQPDGRSEEQNAAGHMLGLPTAGLVGGNRLSRVRPPNPRPSYLTPMGEVVVGGLVLIACIAWPPLWGIFVLAVVGRFVSRARRGSNRSAVIAGLCVAPAVPDADLSRAGSDGGSHSTEG